MRLGCTVAAAVALIAGFGLGPASAQATCKPGNPACGPTSQPRAAVPLQLKRFMALGPARRAVSPSLPTKLTRLPPPRPKTGLKTGLKTGPKTPATHAGNPFDDLPASAPLTPKAIPTLSIPARALALAPETGGQPAGFAAATTPWLGHGAFATAEEKATLPPGVKIAHAGEINEIDLAADATSVSLITPANAAAAKPASVSTKADAKADGGSWLSRVSDRVVDGVVTAALALRSLF